MTTPLFSPGTGADAAPRAGVHTDSHTGTHTASHLDADFAIDLRGESCPYPVIHTLEALEALTSGQRLRVTVDCPQSFRNVPDDATAAGHTLVGEPQREGPTMTYVFARGAHTPGASPAPGASHAPSAPGAQAKAQSGTQPASPGFFRRFRKKLNR